MRKAPNCAKKCGNGLKCEYLREMTERAIQHPPHLNVASGLVDFITAWDNGGHKVFATISEILLVFV